MKRKRFFIILSLLLISAVFSKAQIITRNINLEDTLKSKLAFYTKQTIAEKMMPSFDLKALLKEDSIEASMGVPFRFGKNLPADIDILKEGTYIKHGDTSIILYKISSKNAQSINLIFDKFHLAENASLVIFNRERSIIYGPVLYKDNPENGIFWTDIIQGESIIIKVEFQSKIASDNQLHISKVIHGYKSVNKLYGDALDCERDIACAEGNGRRSQGNAVCMLMISEANRFCSGSLVNNTSQNLRPFILTAFHCLDGNCNGALDANETNAVNNWLFRFKYESPTCGGVEGTTYVTYNHSTFRSAFFPTDFALLELNQIPGDPTISYAGWSRSTVAATSAYGIHHPSGDVKKISVDNGALTNDNAIRNFGTPCGTVLAYPANTHWRSLYDIGTIEGGSSGSPVFDQNNRIVGHLTGGNTVCPNPPSSIPHAYYGRFDVSWIGGRTDITRLSNWLDPCGTGATTTNTIVSAYITGPSLVCVSGGTFTVNNLPAGSTITWAFSTNLERVTSGTNYITLRAKSNGSGWLRATIASSCGQVILPQKNFLVGLRGSFSGSTSVLYLQTGTWSASASCGKAPYHYSWFLRKEGEGGSYQVGASSSLTLQSVRATKMDKDQKVSENPDKQPAEKTIFYLFVRIGDANGTGYETAEKKIIAYGVVDLVPTYGQEMEELLEKSDTLKSKTFELFPNPASENLTIKLFSEEIDVDDNNIEIIILDKFMRQQRYLKSKSRVNILNVSGLKPDFYFIMIRYNKEQWVEKLIIE